MGRLADFTCILIVVVFSASQVNARRKASSSEASDTCDIAKSARYEDIVDRGDSLFRAGDRDRAISCYRRATTTKPKETLGWTRHAMGLELMGDVDGAIAVLHDGKTRTTNPGPLLSAVGILHHKRGEKTDAIASLQLALRYPLSLAEYNDLGLAASELDLHGTAIVAFESALATEPNHDALLNNQGTVLHKARRLNDALRSFEKAAAIKKEVDAYQYNAADVLRELGRYKDAVSYMRKAYEIAPSTERLQELVNILDMAGEYNEALEVLDGAEEGEIGAWENAMMRGDLLSSALRTEEARDEFVRAVRLSPGGNHTALYSSFHLSQYLLDFEAWNRDQERVLDALDEELAKDRTALTPMLALAFLDGPRMRRVAEVAAKRWPTAEGKPKARTQKDILRVAFVSADLQGENPMAHLVGGLFGLFDKARFAVTVLDARASISLPPPKRSDGVAVVPLSGLSASEAAEKIRGMKVDVLVDLNGYTDAGRLDIFAERAAPLQLSFLGWPASTGAPFIDAFISDEALVPAEHQAHFSEPQLRLPFSIFTWANPPSMVRGERSSCVLEVPADAFVFGFFNQGFKVSEALVDAWAQILNGAPGSVLVVLDYPAGTTARVTAALADRGVAASRLVEASFTEHDLHLRRLAHCIDLSLDAFKYTGGATAVDSLHAGVPYLTVAGDRTAARLATSILTTLGTKDLIASDAASYVATALRLARDRAAMETLRGALTSSALTASPLFNATHWLREGLEPAILKAWQGSSERA